VLASDAARLPVEWPGRIWREASGRLRSQHAVRIDTVVLVRPDGYVGFRSQPAQLAPLLAHLEKYLIGDASARTDASGRNSMALTG
jgi:hypothetical protein